VGHVRTFDTRRDRDKQFAEGDKVILDIL
jgi:hypothetical protein